jgi:hypothetical protein
MEEHDQITTQVRRSLGRADRFDNYREIAARFDSVGACGHPIKKGDAIGYNARAKVCRCSTCWSKWVAENRAAAADEAFMSGGSW